MNTTKQQLIEHLADCDGEYRYRDIGYGAFHGDKFIVLGKEVTLTLKDLEDMYEEAMSPLLASAREEFGI